MNQLFGKGFAGSFVVEVQRPAAGAGSVQQDPVEAEKIVQLPGIPLDHVDPAAAQFLQVGSVGLGLVDQITHGTQHDIAMGISEEIDKVAESALEGGIIGNGLADVIIVPKVADDVVAAALERGTRVRGHRISEQTAVLLIGKLHLGGDGKRRQHQCTE